MANTVVMEALSPTMEEGRLVKWTKAVGDAVKTGDTLAEVETDKAVMELVARADGQLLKQMVAEGATVPVGEVVALIGAPGETAAAAPAAPVKSAPASIATQPSAVSHQPSAVTTRPPTPVAPADASRVVRASPLAKRLAKERGVDLKLVQGSGPGGRIILRDLESAAPVIGAALPETARPLPTPISVAPVPIGAGFRDTPLTQIRKTIAKRLGQSLGPIPHFFLTTEVDMERAAEARESLNKQLGDQGKISVTDVILKATALALGKHPACNAWWMDDHIRYWNDVHLGVAVAVEDGLITPVVRHADRKSLAQIGAETRELAGRARERRLKPEEYTGSTFSVSNLGMFDIDEFTAVINPPEAGILAVGAMVAKPVVVDGQVVVRRRLRMTMSCDHRVIDGATGAAFLKTLKQMLENPLAML